MIRLSTLFGLLLLLAAGRSWAVPPTPELLDTLTDPAERALFSFEPFADDPPQELRTGIAARLAQGQTVEVRIVVLLADFVDRPAQGPQRDLSLLYDRLFSRGVVPGGSMADFYAENSNDRLLLTGEIHGWYRMPQRYDTYVGGQAGLGFYPLNSQGLVRDVIKLGDRDVNYARFDNDGPDGIADTIDDDKRVDLLLVVHTGTGTEGSSSRFELRAIAWAVPEYLYHDGVLVTDFALCPWGGALGVFAHETGHLFGLPDLYDLTGQSFGLGTWSVMAGGWSLDGGATPAHFDAWCKYRLGIIDPVNVTGTLENQPIAPVETGGAVYRLAPGGSAGFQYYLVENRRRLGYDAFLPGEGLLIYHVDEQRPTNNLPPHYRVALEQADGLYQLENLFGNPSFGDAGDPWTGATPTGGFGRFTVPDSRNYEGQETGVAVYNIQGPDPLGGMTANFRVTKGAVVRIQSIDVAPVDGDGDRFLDAGETFEIRPELRVEGGDAHEVVVEVATTEPRLMLETTRIEVGTLGPGLHPAVAPIRGRFDGELPTNPYGLPISLRVNFREEVPARTSINIGAGDVEGLSSNFETNLEGYQSRALRIGRYDVWRYELSGGKGGTRAWHAGNAAGGYRGDADAALHTPLFLVPPNARLQFDTLVEITPDDSGRVMAGGFVEISVNGGAWTQITPTRGYDVKYFSADGELNNRGILTGIRPVWERLEFDLSRFSGSAIVRFRFFSEGSRFNGLGWWIDNPVVESAVPVRLLDLSAERTDAGVELHWRLDPDDLPAAVRVDCARAEAPADRRFVDSRPGTPEGGLADPLAPAGVDLDYRLEAVTRAGEILALGRIRVPAASGPAPPFRLAADPNPCRSGSTFSFALSRPGPVRLTLFDASGRAVRRLLDEPRETGAHRLAWDGRDDQGRRLSAGLYFGRIESPDGSRVTRVVVLP